MRQVRDKNLPPNGWALWFLSLGIKWLGHKADHSPPSSADVKIEWSCNLISSHAFVAHTGTPLQSTDDSKIESKAPYGQAQCY